MDQKHIGQNRLTFDTSGRRYRFGAVVVFLTLVLSMLSAFALTAPTAQAVPAGSEYPATWTVTGNIARGTTPSGIQVTATLTGPATFSTPAGLVPTGPTPSYFPPTTTQALWITEDACTTSGPSGCGSITYSYSQAVTTPVLYLGDVGSSTLSSSNIIETYRNTPHTLTSGGTFSLDSPGSQTTNNAITNNGTTVGNIDPAGRVGQVGSVNSCQANGFGCGVYAINTPTQFVDSITFGLGYAGAGAPLDVSTQVVGVTPIQSSLTVAKSAAPASITAAGQAVTYSFAVTNTGNSPLTGVSVTDTAFTGTGTLGPITCPTTTLAAGASTTCTATYTATQADVDAGQVNNTATASGTDPTGAAITSTPSSAVVTATPAPALTLAKSASPSSADDYTVGQVIDYSFLVTNTGNVTLTNVTVNEGDFTGSGSMSAITCPNASGSLSPGASVTCTATYTLTQADIDRGSTTNTATATGTPPGTTTPPTSPPSTVTIPVTPAPAITVEKTADLTTLTTAGQTVQYSFLVQNTGNVTLTDVAVNDTDFTGTGTAPTISCPAGASSLAPGATITCTASYIVTQADIDSGALTNTATATGTPPGTTPAPVSEPSTVTVPAAQNPALGIVKTASPSNAESYVVGQVIDYTFAVTNTGNVTLTDVTVTEGDFTGTGALSPLAPASVATLAPGATTQFTASYTLTQADVDAGSVSNSATATGTPPGGGTPPTSPPSTVEIPVTPAPALTVSKTSDTTEITEAGQTVTYSFVVTNTGNVTASNVTPVEGEFTGTGDLSAFTPGPVSLAPGQSATFTATYVVTQADVDSGALSNTASAAATTPGGDPFPPAPPSSVEIPTNATPGISVVKSADITQDEFAAGTEVTYSFVAQNTGNVTLTDVTIDEGEFSGTGTLSAITPAAVATLAPGETATFTATYVLTQADVDAGEVTNTATATGTPVFRNSNEPNTPLTSTPSSAVVPVEEAPAVTVDKTADVTTLTQAGQTVTYSFLVTNTGNTTITDPVINETEFSGTGELSPVTGPEGDVVLLPGEVVTYTATYVVTQADVDSGALTNTATVTGTTPGGDPTDPSTPSTVTVPTAPAPSLTIVKTADKASVTGVGQIITYTFTVTNTGNVTQRDIAIVEGQFTGSGQLGPVVCNAGTEALAPGAVLVCTAQYQTTAADVRAGAVSNTAVVSGEPAVTTTPGERTVSDPSTARVTVTAPTVLAFTGTDGLSGLLGLGGGLILLGALLIPAVRRRRIEG